MGKMMTTDSFRNNIRKFFMTFAAGMAMILLGMLVALFPEIKVSAAGAAAFGSAHYEPLPDTDFPVGAYIQNNDGLQIGTYTFTLTFDPDVLTFVSSTVTGGTATFNASTPGTVEISGSSTEGGRVQHMMMFHSAKKGNSRITVSSAVINDVTGMPMTIDPFPSVPVNIQAAKTTPPKYLKINGKDVPGLMEGRTEYTFSIPYADEVTIEAPAGYTIKTDTKELEVGKNNVRLEISNNGGEPIIYVLHVSMEDERTDKKETSEKSSEDSGEDDSEDSSEDDSEALSEKESEKKPEKVSEPKPEPKLELPSMPESESKPENTKEERNYILFLVGFAGLIMLIVFSKLIHDAIVDRQGRTSDVKRITFKSNLAKQEKIDESADPFTFASFDEKDAETVGPSNLDFHLKTPEEIRREESAEAAADKEEEKVDHTNLFGTPIAPKKPVDEGIPMIDFSKRKSAASMARAGANNADWDSMKDGSEDGDDDDGFVDLDGVSDRKPKKKK